MTTDANNPGVGAESNPQADAETELAIDATEQETEVVENEDGQPQPQDDETDEIEHEGVKHRIPKALKGAFLMQADYTRKTQEVAEQRKALEEQNTSFRQQAELQQAFLQDVGTITAFDRAIEQFRAIDWQSLRVQNPEAFQQRWLEYMQLKDARDTAASELHSKVTKRQSEIAAETAKRQNELRANLARDIPGYSPELATKMQTFGISTYGFTPQEIAATTDARLHRLMHDAMIGRQLQEKAAKTAAAAKTAQAAEAAKPAAQVGNRASSTKLDPSSPAGDKLSGQEWLRRRNEQLRQQRA